MDPYAIAEYPDGRFHNEREAQRVLTLRRKRKDRCVMRLFLTMMAVFLASLICGILGLPIMIVAGIGLMFILLPPAAFLLIKAPAFDCPSCSKKMRTDWAILEDGRLHEFLLCFACRIYLYAHRTSR
jgi:hypothetical protein